MECSSSSIPGILLCASNVNTAEPTSCLDHRSRHCIELSYIQLSSRDVQKKWGSIMVWVEPGMAGTKSAPDKLLAAERMANEKRLLKANGVHSFCMTDRRPDRQTRIAVLQYSTAP